MERRRLGESGASVGVVGLGTSTWGCGTDASEAREQVRMLLESGGNLVDVGADPVKTGFLADALRDPDVRSEVFISLRTPALTSQRDLLASLDTSLEEMGRDHVDLWTIEGWCPDLPWEELVAALAVASATGRVRYLGSAPQDAWQAALLGSALAMHPQRACLASITVPYSLLDRDDAETATLVASTLRSGVLAAWPLAGGVLTGKYRHATPPDSRGAGERHASRIQAYRSAWARPVVDGLCAAAEGLGASPSAIALAWLRGRSGVASSLVGARTVHQWRAALASPDVSIPPEIREVLDEVSAHAMRIRDHGDATVDGA